MRYISTRGNMQHSSYTEVLLEGLAPDGGLTVPEILPKLDGEQLEAWRPLPYAQLAAQVIGLFATDIPAEDLQRLCANAYNTQNFQAAEIVPLTPIGDGITLVGLSEGPTLAFKDMAMQYLGQALEYVLAQRSGVLNVLGATSGDTGSAAEYALRGKSGISVFMLSPQGRMSDFQRAQMYSLTEPNIYNLAIDGVFDDCQQLLKSLSADLDFKRSHHLGTVNSINLGRISAQIVYYVWAWLRASDQCVSSERKHYRVSFTVPSGNFGNLLSGHYARCMGLPIHRLVLATNENNVLDEFFRTGVYTPRSAAATYRTSSPSMDISKASNLERFIFDLFDRDPRRLIASWHELEQSGTIDLAAEQHRFASEFHLVSGSSTHADRVATIRAVHQRNGMILDPHTADGVKVAAEHLDEQVPMLVLETAKAAKFPEIVAEAIGTPAALPSHLAGLLDRSQHVFSLPNEAAAVRSFVAARAVTSCI